MSIKSGTKIEDNVKITLTNEKTGKQREFSSHNTALNYALSSFAKWIGGKNNFGYQPVSPPTQCQLGSGSGTPASTDAGLFSPIAGSLVTANYINSNNPSNGTTTFVFQIPAGIVTGQVTEALMRDTSGNGWYHTMFPVPFTPSSAENITVQWETTFNS